MSKKGIVLSIVLAILVLSIVIIIAKQNSNISEITKKPEVKQEQNDDFELNTNSKNFDLDKLKSYNLPILIQLRK